MWSWNNLTKQAAKVKRDIWNNIFVIKCCLFLQYCKLDIAFIGNTWNKCYEISLDLRF